MNLKTQLKVPVRCPGCQRTQEKSLKELELSPIVRCTCGAQITVGGDLNQVTRSVGKLEKAFDSLKKLGR